MPGVLIIESMAQTAAVLVVETLGPDAAGKVVYFMSIEGAKFRRPVMPGDQLRIHVTKERNRGNVWKFHAVARVDGDLGRRGHLRRHDHGPRGADRVSRQIAGVSGAGGLPQIRPKSPYETRNSCRPIDDIRCNNDCVGHSRALRLG